MTDTFLNTTKEIAKEFIQSIVFIDDEVYLDKDDQGHKIDPKEIMRAFAKHSKNCSIYSPENQEDLDSLINISKKSDVVILDWNMKLSSLNDNDDNDDEIEEEEDPRGIYTIKMIEKILFDSSNNPRGLKSIIVYTADINLRDHIDRIYKKVKAIDPDVRKTDFNITGNSYKISAILKESAKVGDHTTEDLRERVFKFEELPEFVFNDFSSITNGILPSFSLKSLTIIRNNASRILGLFSKELDSAYLAHKSLLPNQENAKDLLVEMFKDALADTLSYSSVSDFITKDFITGWISQNLEEEDKKIKNSKGKDLNPSIMFKRDHELIKNLLYEEENNVKKRFENKFKSLIEDKEKRNDHLDALSKDSTDLFINNNELSKKDSINRNFAKLTHHRSLFLPNKSEPKLTLGTIVKSTKDSEKYYVCIQQKCDSVRLYNTERKFLFLPLEKVKKGKFHFLTPNGEMLTLKNKSFQVRTVKFIGHKTEGTVKAELQDEKYIFQQKYNEESDEQFEWVLDLKDLHAQRIANEYASQLSRIGLDESEWLRRSLN